MPKILDKTFHQIVALANKSSWNEIIKGAKPEVCKRRKEVVLANIDRFIDFGCVPVEFLETLNEEELVSILERGNVEKTSPKGTKYSDLIRANMPRGWNQVFDDEMLKEIDAIESVLDESGEQRTPTKSDVFNAYYLTPLQSVKMVIVGQNPYHQPNLAMGLSFSGKPDQKIPASLKNIYALAERDVPGFVSPDHPDLSLWAMRGVMMLNTSLTSELNNIKNVHGALWKILLTKTLNAIHESNPDCVYLLWGRDAQSLQLNDEIQNKVTTVHPSPMNNGGEQFKASQCFLKANNILKAKGIPQVNFNIPHRKFLSKEYELIKQKWKDFDEELINDISNIEL